MVLHFLQTGVYIGSILYIGKKGKRKSPEKAKTNESIIHTKDYSLQVNSGTDVKNMTETYLKFENFLQAFAFPDSKKEFNIMCLVNQFEGLAAQTK